MEARATPSEYRPGMKTVEACVATYFWFVLLPTINGSLLTGDTNLIRTVIEIASGTRGHVQTALINARNSAHDFGVKLSPCMCSHISGPGWRNDWPM